MEKDAGEHLSGYRVGRIVPTSWEDAVRDAIDSSSESLWNLRIVEVKELDVNLDKTGKIIAYRAKMRVSLKYDNWKREMGWETRI